jgi:hypothetical protein
MRNKKLKKRSTKRKKGNEKTDFIDDLQPEAGWKGRSGIAGPELGNDAILAVVVVERGLDGKKLSKPRR